MMFKDAYPKEQNIITAVFYIHQSSKAKHIFASPLIMIAAIFPSCLHMFTTNLYLQEYIS